MQFIDDDIDQLFRRAAEDYPLKTNTSDWNKVLNALQDKEQPKKKDKRRFFLFLLSMTIFWSINTYVGYIQNNPDQNILSKTNSILDNRDQNTTEKENNLYNTKTNKLIPEEKNELNTTVSIYQNNYTFRNQTSIGKTLSKSQSTPPTKSFNEKPFVNQNKENTQTDKTVLPKNNSIEQQSSIIIAQKEASVTNTIADKTIDKKDSIETTTLSIAPKQEKQKKNKQSLYVGIIGGIDFSTIKMQKVSGAGYTAGVLVGYNLNKRWSIESGAFLDQKSYYSDGKYFNPKLYPNWDLKSVEGICRMIEIPITAKYNFGTKPSGWFATAGLSSYLMKLEDYDYSYTVGSSQPYGSYKTFKNSTNNWLSIMHFSVGYSKQIGKIGTLRAEPYFKIPLKGLGIGQLPISSTGINIGFTRNIF